MRLRFKIKENVNRLAEKFGEAFLNACHALD